MALQVILPNILHNYSSCSFLVNIFPKLSTTKRVALHEALLPSVNEIRWIDTLFCVIWVISPHKWGPVLAGVQLVEYFSILKLEHIFFNRKA